jgi:hypothetical protein
VCRVWVCGLCQVGVDYKLHTLLCRKVVESLVDRNDLQHLEPRVLGREFQHVMIRELTGPETRRME